MKEKSVEEGVAPLTLIKVIAMHWNSHVSCLLRLLDVQKVVNGICSERDYGLRCSVCHACFPDEGVDVWRPVLRRRGRRSLGEVRNEGETSTGDN
jgi:hypothetical protein